MQRPCMRTVWFIVLLVGLVGNCCCAQDAFTTDQVLALVPPDAIGLVTIRPRAIAQDEALKMLPVEIASAACLDELGFDPLKIERMDAIVGMLGIQGPQIAVLISYGEDIPDEVLKLFDLNGPKKTQGLDLWPVEKAPGIVAYLKRPRQAIVGTEAYVLRLLKSPPVDGELRQLAGKVSEPGQFSIILALEPLRDMLVGFSQMPQLERLQPQIAADVETLAAKTRMIAVRAQLGLKPFTAIALEAGSEADAAALETALTRLIDQFTTAMITEVKKQAAREPGRVAAATVAYITRLTDEMKRELAFQRSGTRLMTRLSGNQMGFWQAGVMTGLLLPAVQAARDAARRMQSSNNLKQIVLAIHNYASAMKDLPSDADKSNDPNATSGSNLSWRVKLLPYLEQQALYDEFHHDEPWNSPHNIKLLERMPDVFKNPRSNAPAGHTVYQMPTGEHLAGEPGKRLRFEAFTDGLDKTVAVAATVDSAAVPWTKPGDFNPLVNPETLRTDNNVFEMVFMDGAMKMISADVPPESLRAMFTRDGND